MINDWDRQIQARIEGIKGEAPSDKLVPSLKATCTSRRR
jgi:hypothetical protein